MEFHQTTDYTCGPACVKFITEYLGYGEVDEMELANKLGANPEIGTSNEILSRYCEERFGAWCGYGIYKGGLAIANIRNWRCGTGHYVVFIRGDKDCVMIFDPDDGKIHSKKWAEIEFKSGCGSHDKFTINFQ